MLKQILFLGIFTQNMTELASFLNIKQAFRS